MDRPKTGARGKQMGVRPAARASLAVSQSSADSSVFFNFFSVVSKGHQGSGVDRSCQLSSCWIKFWHVLNPLPQSI